MVTGGWRGILERIPARREHPEITQPAFPEHYSAHQGKVDMARVMIRLLDPDENPYDFFIGEAADCPPLPRVGDYVDYHLRKGRVEQVVHIIAFPMKVRLWSGMRRCLTVGVSR